MPTVPPDSIKDSRPHQKPRDYLARREQYRLIGLVFSLLLVCFLVVEAGKPKNWRWFFGDEPAVGQDSDIVVDGTDIDTTLDEPIKRAAPLPEGVFVSSADVPSDNATDDAAAPAPLVDTQIESADTIGVGLPTAADYAAVKDDTVFRAAEAAAWYKLLAYLKNSDNTALRAASLGSTSYAQLHSSPVSFRGRVVELTGEVRRAHYLDAPKNDYGIDGYWQCWLRAPNSLNPVVVYALEMPDDFPQGLKIQERVDFTGVFLKRWAYASSSGSRVAPLVVAGRGIWFPERAAAERALPSLERIAMLIVACGLFAAAIAWLANRFALGKRIARDDTATMSVTIPKNQELPSVENATEGFLGRLETDDEDA